MINDANVSHNTNIYCPNYFVSSYQQEKSYPYVHLEENWSTVPEWYFI